MNRQTALTLLRIAGFATAASGVLTATFALPAVAGIGQSLIGLLDGPIPLPDPLDAHHRLYVAIASGLTVALGLLYATVVVPALEAGLDRLRRPATGALLAWFLVDSAGSIAAGVAFNALVNLALLALFLVPLLALGRPVAAAAA